MILGLCQRWNNVGWQTLVYMFFYNHMKFWNQARLCLAIFDFEASIILSLCLIIQGIKLWEKFNTRLVTKCEYLFSDFYRFVNILKKKYCDSFIIERI